MKLHEIIKELELTSKSTEKMEILQRHKGNNELSFFFSLCLSPSFISYIKKYTVNGIGTEDLDISWFYHSFYKDICQRKITGHAAIQKLEEFYRTLNNDGQDLVRRIIARKPDCGVSASTVNKVWDQLIPKQPCLLASAYSDKLLSKFNWEEGVYVQDKMDGMRSTFNVYSASTSNSLAVGKTRNGKTLFLHYCFDELCKDFDGWAIDGELVALDKQGNPLDRKTSNGICNKAINGTISPEEADSLRLFVWDMVPLLDFNPKGSYEVSYDERWKKLLEMEPELNAARCILVNTNIVYSPEEASQLYKDAIASGKEGIIIKDRDMIWEDKRSKKQMKFKEVLDIDLPITGFTEGTGKYQGMLGSLTCSDGDITVSVGTGFSDAQRKEFWERREELVDKIAELNYNEIITDKSTGTKSLFLPVFIELREDKDE